MKSNIILPRLGTYFPHNDLDVFDLRDDGSNSPEVIATVDDGPAEGSSINLENININSYLL